MTVWKLIVCLLVKCNFISRFLLLFSLAEALLSESLSLSLDELELESEDSERPRECGNLAAAPAPGLPRLLTPWPGDPVEAGAAAALCLCCGVLGLGARGPCGLSGSRLTV